MRMDLLSKSPFLYLQRRNNPVILMYHGIAPKSPIYLNERHISPDVFETHIKFLKKYCSIISLDALYEGDYDNEKKNVVITFDDGYWNNLEFALPIIEKHKAPASIFITGINRTSKNILWSDLHDLIAASDIQEVEHKGVIYKRSGYGYMPFVSLDGNNFHDVVKALSFHEKYELLDQYYPEKLIENQKFDVYWKLLSDKEISSISSSEYIKIGSHGFFHNNLGWISISDLETELKHSKEYLSGLTGKEMNSLAFPDGSYSMETIDIALKLGFDKLLAVNPNTETDLDIPELKSRVGLYEYETLGMQKIKMLQ